MPAPDPMGQQAGNQSQQQQQQAAPAGLTQEQVNAALATHAAGVTKTVEDWSKQIIAGLRGQQQQQQQQNQQRQQQQARAADPATELIAALAAGDLSPIQNAQSEAARKAVEDALKPIMPWIQTQVRDAGGAHEAAFRAAVDQRWGEGAFDKIVKPLVDQGFGDNQAARSSRETVDNVVKWAIGEKVDDLLKHKTAADDTAKAKAEEERKKMPQPYLLGNGLQLPDGVSLSAEDAADAARIEAATGETVDRGRAAKLIGLMAQKREGISRRDFKQAMAA